MTKKSIIRVAAFTLLGLMPLTQLKAQGTLRIFLLLGQSNMEGQAYTFDSLQTTNWNIPTMEFLLSGTAAATNYRANMPFTFEPSLDASWMNPQTNVWAVHYDSVNGNTKNVQVSNSPWVVFNGIGPLSPGFGLNTNFGSMIGAELSMGIRLDQATSDPIFLFKSDKGGTTLGNDWRPPTAVAARGGTVGPHYVNSMNRFRAFLDVLDADLLDDGLLNAYSNATAYAISGVFWFQGWNEQFNSGPYSAAQLMAEYKDNLKDLIYSIRAEDPRMPGNLGIIIGESSDQNVSLNTSRTGAVAELNWEIPNSAVYFDTMGMKGTDWGNNELGAPFSQGWGYHFHARAENFLEIGWKAGGAAISNGFLSPSPLWFDAPVISGLMPTQATATANLNADADEVIMVWGTNDYGTGSIAIWSNQLSLGASTAGLVQATLTGLVEATDYVMRFFATNAGPADLVWSGPVGFTTPWVFPPPLWGEPGEAALFVDGATVTCRLMQATANVFIAWAFTDQGETDLAGWTNAPGGGMVTLGPTGVNEVVSFQIIGLNADTEYYYRYYGTNGTGDDWSNTGRFATVISPGHSPSNLTATATHQSRIELSWTENFNTETGFLIRRATDIGFTTNVVFFNVGVDAVGYADQSVSPETTYYYTVAPLHLTGQGTYSAIGSATTPVSIGILAVYYDFEGNFNDYPGAGITNDDLTTVTGGLLVSNVPANAKNSTQSYYVDNNISYQTAQTDAWSLDLASTDAYTVMFWIKCDNQLQNNSNTRVISMRFTPANGTAALPAWQIEGFGASNPNNFDLRFHNPNLFAADAVNVVGNDGNPTNDVWHHVTFVISNTGHPGNGGAFSETFVDGVSVGLVPQGNYTDNRLGSTDAKLIIGGHNTRNRGTTGFLDDFAIFSDILPASNILEIATGLKSPADFLGPPVPTGPDLVLSKTVSPANIGVETNLTYTIDVMNSSTGLLGGIVVTDSLPSEVVYLFAVPPASQTNGNSYTFSLGDLAGNASTSITLYTTLTSSVPGAITNWAYVVSAHVESTLTNNRDTAVTVLLDLDGDGLNNPLDPDADGDGMANNAEIIANTDPLNAASFLWLAISRTTNGLIQNLTFPTSTGRTYRIQGTSNLNVGPWSDAKTGIAGDGSIMIWPDTNFADRIYYRVGVESP